MTRPELIKRLYAIRRQSNEWRTKNNIDGLIFDIENDGVLDVQASREIAETMNLPRPKR